MRAEVTLRRFPTEPLRRFLLALGDAEHPTTVGVRKTGLKAFCLELGINPRPLYRDTLTDYTIDAICCTVGIHPYEVYADWFVLPPGLLDEVI